LPNKTDVLFLAWERPAFTLQSFQALCDGQRDTDVHDLFVYTDGYALPFDPTNDDVFGPMARKVIVDTGKFGGPVACMNDFLINRARYFRSKPNRGNFTVPYFLKVDNDLVLPPGAIAQLLDVAAEHNNSIDLLGIEPWCPELAAMMNPELAGQCAGVALHRHIGGIGLMRYDAFRCRNCRRDSAVPCGECYGDRLNLPSPARDGRYGFTEWQWNRDDLTKAFLNPPLKCFLLDHLPIEPWLGYSKGYVRDGVQRQPWDTYPQELHHLWDWWTGLPPL